MYKLHHVTLDDFEGQGYAFKKRTAFGKARHGVFFADTEEELSELQQKDVLVYNGPCYYRTRGPRDREFEIAITEVTPTAMGYRADFEAIDNPEPVLETDLEEIS